MGNHFLLEKAFGDHEPLFKMVALSDFFEITLKKRSLYKDCFKIGCKAHSKYI